MVLYQCHWGGDQYCGDMTYYSDIGDVCSAETGSLWCPEDGVYETGIDDGYCYMAIAFFYTEDESGGHSGDASSDILCWT